jgi:hypothetical protein
VPIPAFAITRPLPRAIIDLHQPGLMPHKTNWQGTGRMAARLDREPGAVLKFGHQINTIDFRLNPQASLLFNRDFSL